MPASRFRKKSPEAEAIQLLNGDTVDVCRWLMLRGIAYTTVTHATDARRDQIVIQVGRKTMAVVDGDWVLVGEPDDVDVVADWVFTQTYEPVT